MVGQFDCYIVYACHIVVPCGRVGLVAAAVGYINGCVLFIYIFNLDIQAVCKQVTVGYFVSYAVSRLDGGTLVANADGEANPVAGNHFAKRNFAADYRCLDNGFLAVDRSRLSNFAYGCFDGNFTAGYRNVYIVFTGKQCERRTRNKAYAQCYY